MLLMLLKIASINIAGNIMLVDSKIFHNYENLKTVKLKVEDYLSFNQNSNLFPNTINISCFPISSTSLNLNIFYFIFAIIYCLFIIKKVSFH